MLTINRARLLVFLMGELDSDLEAQESCDALVRECNAEINGNTIKIYNDNKFFEKLSKIVYTARCSVCTVDRIFRAFVADAENDAKQFLSKRGMTTSCHPRGCKACWNIAVFGNILEELLIDVAKIISKGTNKDIVFKKKGE